MGIRGLHHLIGRPMGPLPKGDMAKHSAADEQHDKTSTYGHRSRLDVENTKLGKKMVEEGKVKPPEGK